MAADAAPRREPVEYLDDLGLAELPTLLQPRQVAEILDVAPQTIHNLVRGGELAVVRLGPQSYRIFRRSLEEFLRRNME